MEETPVTIPASGADVELAGALATHGCPTAAALLLPGSGPQDRDETIAGQKPLLQLAHGLAAYGVASLRCDDRGVGGSGGEYLSIDGEALGKDVARQSAWLGARFPDLPVAVVGHSQGALFALRLAACDPRIGRVVLLAGAIRPGMQSMMAMRRQMADDAGLEEADRESYLAHSRALFEAISTIDDPVRRRAAVLALVTESVAGASDADFAPDFGSVAEYIEYAIADALEWEVRELLRADARATLAQVAAPVLAIWGRLDRHVDAAAEIAAFRSGARAESEARILPDMNHLFQRSKTGRIEDYANDGPPMQDPIPALVAAWITAAPRP
ncbi:MAG: alpha/beta hydrolase [Phycisphaerales bacterium]